MKMRNLLAATVLGAAVSVSAVQISVPAFASSAHQAYSCTQDPTQSQCTTTPAKAQSQGNVTGVVSGSTPTHPTAGGGAAPGAAVQALPATGGANPSSPESPLLPLLAAGALALTGVGLRRIR